MRFRNSARDGFIALLSPLAPDTSVVVQLIVGTYSVETPDSAASTCVLRLRRYIGDCLRQLHINNELQPGRARRRAPALGTWTEEEVPLAFWSSCCLPRRVCTPRQPAEVVRRQPDCLLPSGQPRHESAFTAVTHRMLS